MAYLEWLALAAAGPSIGALVSIPVVAVLAVFWTMGIVYNVPPNRSKKLPYLDVFSEAVSNPLRLLLG